MEDLIDNLFLKYLNNDIINKKDDASPVPEIKGVPVISTDTFVVDPIFFPGGNIGKLSICGTVNDLAVTGAIPLYLTVGFILEEGLPIKHLEKIIISMAEVSREANVKIVAGDTKVVERGKGDKIFINTTGVGMIGDKLKLSDENIKLGDKVIINGSIAEHGLAILMERNQMDFSTSIKSDCCTLSDLIVTLLSETNGIKFMRDPTRGGMATVLNEIATRYNVGIEIEEEKVPLGDEIKSLCKILGLDPLYLANEGKVLIIADREKSEKIVDIMRRHPYGRNSSIIGTIVDNNDQQVYLKTRIGGKRIITKLMHDMLPRIC